MHLPAMPAHQLAWYPCCCICPGHWGSPSATCHVCRREIQNLGSKAVACKLPNWPAERPPAVVPQRNCHLPLMPPAAPAPQSPAGSAASHQAPAGPEAVPCWACVVHSTFRPRAASRLLKTACSVRCHRLAPKGVYTYCHHSTPPHHAQHFFLAIAVSPGRPPGASEGRDWAASLDMRQPNVATAHHSRGQRHGRLRLPPLSMLCTAFLSCSCWEPWPASGRIRRTGLGGRRRHGTAINHHSAQLPRGTCRCCACCALLSSCQAPCPGSPGRPRK